MHIQRELSIETLSVGQMDFHIYGTELSASSFINIFTTLI